MRNRFCLTAVGLAFAITLMTATLTAQAPAAPAAAPFAVANPTYVTIPLEIMVNRPAAEVWKRVGKYCDIGEWMRINCTIIAGKAGRRCARWSTKCSLARPASTPAHRCRKGVHAICIGTSGCW
jgi:hypothetical protein